MYSTLLFTVHTPSLSPTRMQTHTHIHSLLLLVHRVVAHIVSGWREPCLRVICKYTHNIISQQQEALM